MAWKIRFLAKEMAKMLSHHSLGGQVRTKPTLMSNLHIQMSSAAVFANDLYLASVEDLAAIGYFLDSN